MSTNPAAVLSAYQQAAADRWAALSNLRQERAAHLHHALLALAPQPWRPLARRAGFYTLRPGVTRSQKAAKTIYDQAVHDLRCGYAMSERAALCWDAVEGVYFLATSEAALRYYVELRARQLTTAVTTLGMVIAAGALGPAQVLSVRRLLRDADRIREDLVDLRLAAAT